MITRILTILLIVFALLGATGGAVSIAQVAPAATPLPSAHDTALLALINQARQNPLAVAASMGMDPEKVVRNLPGLEKILREGLPPVAFNANLFDAARAHTQDMFARGYYSHDTPDGLGYDARIRNSGYPAAATGESLGMLLFANFIKPGDAARLLFEYIFWDELDPARTEKRNILDPALQEVGASVKTGSLRLGGKLWNVYLATCDFAAVAVPPPLPEPTPIPTPEGELLRLVNQARSNPLGTAAAFGIDADAYLEGRPELRSAFEQGLAPLTIHVSLANAALAHVQDMLAKNYLSRVSPDGRTHQERIAEQGYRPTVAGESLAVTWFTDPIDPFLAAGLIFERMFREEFDPSKAGELSILDPRMTEAGIALQKGVFRSGAWAWNAYVAICDVAAPAPLDPGGP